jgi:hypothetical protein
LWRCRTGGFGPLSAKLDALLDEHRVRIVHPVAAQRRIVRVDEHGEVVSIRGSPKRGTAIEVFDKLIAFPSRLTHPNLTVEVVLVREDHIRAARPVTARRRTRDSGERQLGDVLDRIELRAADDVRRALPPLPQEPFSTRELASLVGCSMCSRSGRRTACGRSRSFKGPGEASSRSRGARAVPLAA